MVRSHDLHDMRAPARHDAVVVGGGINGASVLFFLASRGVDAALFERSSLASGPTGRSSACVRIHYFMPELVELANRGRTLYRDFAEVTGDDCGFVQTGELYGVGADQAAVFRDNVRRLQERGFEIEAVEPADMAAMAPNFELDGIGVGMWEPSSGYADPVRATTGLARRAVELGATVHARSPIARIVLSGGRVAGVETAAGRGVAADVVIVAAGPWTRALLKTAGVDLPLHAERHSVTILDTPASSRAIVPWVWADFPGGYYARPEGPSSLLVAPGGATPPLADPDRFEEGVTIDESASVLGRAARRIPALGQLGVKGGWAALYDMSPDKLHLVGEVPGISGLFVVAGTSGHGFKLAPGIGEEVARLVTTGASELLEPFRLDRTFDAEREQQPR